jgi:predicted aldo/keto reductase-like oxidoreductase
MNKLSKAKCEKCEHCKLITPYDVIICDFLNSLNSLYAMAYVRPKMCSNFKKKGGAE